MMIDECTLKCTTLEAFKHLNNLSSVSLSGGAVVEHAVQAAEEEPVPGGAGARAAGEERAPAQERARRPQRVAQEAHREPLPQQGREGGARQEAQHHAAAG